MQSVNRGFMWAFGCMLAVVAVLLVGMWQVALVVLAGAAGYAVYRINLAERWRELMRRRRG